MKAILEFNLPDDEEDYRRARDGAKAFIVLSDLDNWLRDKIKYSNTTTEDEKIVFGLCRDELQNLMMDENIPIL